MLYLDETTYNARYSICKGLLSFWLCAHESEKRNSRYQANRDIIKIFIALAFKAQR